jgi:GT2 family glycosyltransferase
MRMPFPLSGPDPLFSVIVVNWNGRDLLGECLDSVLSEQDGSIEIIVVDNGSTDGSADFIRKRYGNRIRLIELAGNEGWAGGNNRGIETARGAHLVLLNNDACLEREFFRHLREGIARYPDVGMYSTKILNYRDRSLIDNTGHVIYRDGTARGRGRLRKDGPEFDQEAEVLCPSGAAGVYSRKLIDRVGPVDERYFAYGEDTELGLRARKAGFSCHYIPKAVVYHKYSATGGAYTLQKVFHVERNRVWTLLKLYPWSLVAVSPVLTMARYFLGLYGLLAGKGATGKLREGHSPGEIFKVLFRAYRAALADAPEMLRARRKLRSVCTMPDREFRKMITRFSADIREVGFNE